MSSPPQHPHHPHHYHPQHQHSHHHPQQHNHPHPQQHPEQQQPQQRWRRQRQQLRSPTLSPPWSLPWPMLWALLWPLVLLLLTPALALTSREEWMPSAPVTVGLIPPHSNFMLRAYNAKVVSTLQSRSSPLFKNIRQVHRLTLPTPSPTAILNALCNEFLPLNVSAVIYINNKERYGRTTASSQYFLQLARYLGIPVIAWNADNSGLNKEQGSSQSNLRLELAPGVHHQAAAMLSILQRYRWHGLAIVTSQIAGHDEFSRAVMDRTLEITSEKFTILKSIVVKEPKDLEELANSEARIMLLYCTKDEAVAIMEMANNLGITGHKYVWIVTQSVIGSELDMVPTQFSVGMLGLHFETGADEVLNQIRTSLEVFMTGVENYLRHNYGGLQPHLSCQGHGQIRWDEGQDFYKFLLNVTLPHSAESSPSRVAFNPDGTVKYVRLKIMNLRQNANKQLVWEEIGTWASGRDDGLNIKDIVWPGYSHVPPEGVPEKFHLKILFLEEAPYIILGMPDPVTGKCSANRGVLCRVAPETPLSLSGENSSESRNSSEFQCCSGFCIDLLEKFANDLIFTYELVRVSDGKWGTIENGSWNGLVSALMSRKGDMVITSFNINSERESVIDFSVPFLETGTTIVVAKRTGIISPTAFLEPFDIASWMLVAFVAIHATALSIFTFEWLSPSGYNMKIAAPRDHKFSLLRTYWMVWAIIFQAAVHTDCPKGLTARFMAAMWALFAVVFLAIYTANLAAFMITREEFHELTGINDIRMTDPNSVDPSFRAGTVLFTNTETVLRKHKPVQFGHMLSHVYATAQDGVRDIKRGELDAFLYDATVLQYLVAQDDDCEILTVGSWYGMTGYGVGFRRGSKYLELFNQQLMSYKDNGYIERLQRFWLTGACKPQKQQKRASEPLALEQFLSAFLLLGCGILLAFVILALEHFYFRHLRSYLSKYKNQGCLSLISMSVGNSLNSASAADQGRKTGHHQVPRADHSCHSHLDKLRSELDEARWQIRYLENKLSSDGPMSGVLHTDTRPKSACDLAGRATVGSMASAVRHHIYNMQSEAGLVANSNNSNSNSGRPRSKSVGRLMPVEIAQLETVL